MFRDDGYNEGPALDDYDDPLDDDYYDNYCDDNGHEIDIDIVTGEASCYRCGHTWYLTPEDITREIEHQRAYHEYEQRENRRQWWRDLWERIRSWFPRRKPMPPNTWVSDEEIPF